MGMAYVWTCVYSSYVYVDTRSTTEREKTRYKRHRITLVTLYRLTGGRSPRATTGISGWAPMPTHLAGRCAPPPRFKLRSSLPPRARRCTRRATARRLAAVPVWVSCPIRDLAIGISIIYGIAVHCSGYCSAAEVCVAARARRGGRARGRRPRTDKDRRPPRPAAQPQAGSRTRHAHSSPGADRACSVPAKRVRRPRLRPPPPARQCARE